MLNKNFTLAAVTGNKKYLESYINSIDEGKRFEVLSSLVFECQNFLMDDNLSNVYTRKGLTTIYNMFKEESNNIALTYFDINGLKTINDTYSGKDGDKVISTTTNSINNILRKYGKSYAIIRMGGDEFVVISKETSTEEMTVINGEAAKLAKEKLKKEPYEPSWEVGIVEVEDAERECKETTGETDENKIIRYVINSADEIASSKKQRKKDDEKKTKAMDSFLEMIKENKNELNYLGFKKGKKQGMYEMPDQKYDEETLKLLLQASSETELEELLRTKYDNDYERLLDAAHSIGIYCMQDRKHIVSRNCTNAIGSIINSNEYKSIYFEVKDLKIVNEAYNHDGGDKYINDALNILANSIQIDDNDLQNPNLVLRVSGNGFFIYVKAEQLQETIDKLQQYIKQYNDNRIEDPEINAIILPLEESEDEYADLSQTTIHDLVINAENKAKEVNVENTIKYIYNDNDGRINETLNIYRDRKFFTIGELLEYVESKFADVPRSYRENTKQINGELKRYVAPKEIYDKQFGEIIENIIKLMESRDTGNNLAGTDTSLDEDF